MMDGSLGNEREWTAPGNMAVVVFCDRTDLWWLRILRPGFRHCFVVLFSPPFAIGIESLATGLAIVDFGVTTPHDLTRSFRDQGYRAVIVPCRGRGARSLGPAPFSCVESVKRAIGIARPEIITPHQLWKYFCRNRKKVLTFQK